MIQRTRLEAIADMVQEGTVPADIGTDHAYVPLMLVQSGKAEKAYACDIAEGPLLSAERSIRMKGLDGSVIPVLSDGFENVPDDADAAVITGMGCTNAIRILEEGSGRLESMKQIVVSVHNHTDSLRRWISDRGCTILDEDFVVEKGHGYVLISFCTKPHEPYSEEDILLGPILRKKGLPDYIRSVSAAADNLTRTLVFPSKDREEKIRKKEIMDTYLKETGMTV